MKFDLDIAHDKHDAKFLAHRPLIDALRAQPLGARALKKAQITRVVDHTAGVGVLPVDADGPCECDVTHNLPSFPKRDCGAGCRSEHPRNGWPEGRAADAAK